MRCTWWLDNPSGMGLSCGGGCFSSDTVTSRYPASSSSSAGVEKKVGRGTDKDLLPRAEREQKEPSAIRDRWEEEEEERRSHSISAAAPYRRRKGKWGEWLVGT